MNWINDMPNGVTEVGTNVRVYSYDRDDEKDFGHYAKDCYVEGVVVKLTKKYCTVLVEKDIWGGLPISPSKRYSKLGKEVKFHVNGTPVPKSFHNPNGVLNVIKQIVD